MIIANGTIETKSKTAGGIDPATGFAIPPTQVAWSEPIACQYTANKYNNLGKSNGEHFTVASYSVLIEEQPFSAEQVRLKDRDGNVLGEFSVMQVEPLEAVCELRLLI